MSLINDLMKRGWLYQATGYTVLISFLFLVTALIFFEVPEGNRELFIHAIGVVEGAFVGNMVNHFFGSSSNRGDKPEKPTPETHG